MRNYATHVLNKCYPSTLCMARSNLSQTVPLMPMPVVKRRLLWSFCVVQYVLVQFMIFDLSLTFGCPPLYCPIIVCVSYLQVTQYR
jgi:hypothetical protein